MSNDDSPITDNQVNSQPASRLAVWLPVVRAVAGRLAEDLGRTFGHDAVFLDYRNLDSAGQWPEQLQIEVSNAAVDLVLIGEGWLTAQDEYGRRRINRADDWVRQEVAAGIGGRAKVLPLLVNGTQPVW